MRLRLYLPLTLRFRACSVELSIDASTTMRVLLFSLKSCRDDDKDDDDLDNCRDDEGRGGVNTMDTELSPRRRTAEECKTKSNVAGLPLTSSSCRENLPCDAAKASTTSRLLL